jgi:hypothetical protein
LGVDDDGNVLGVHPDWDYPKSAINSNDTPKAILAINQFLSTHNSLMQKGKEH